MALGGSGSGLAFWNTDLKDIEADFLEGRKITELPVCLTDAAPPQGSVLLNRAIDIDRKMSAGDRTAAGSVWRCVAGLLKGR